MVKPAQDTTKNAEAGPADGFVDSGAGNPDDPFGMAEWLRDMPKVPLHPLMQHPAAAMAAATAIGLGMTGQIAGFMLGAMRGMVETAQNTTAAEAPTDVMAAVETKPAAMKKPGSPKVSAKSAPVREAKPVAIAAEKPKRTKTASVVEAPADDLKKISGIGPKLEQVLNGMGVRRYADVALWSDKDVKRFDEQLGFGGRIARDGWVEQAKALSKG